MPHLDYDIPVRRFRAVDAAALDLDRSRPSYRFPVGFQMLFYGNQKPITLVNHCLAQMVRSQIEGGKEWRQTQQSYADDAAQATTFFHSQGRTWEGLDLQLVTQYAAALLSGYSVWSRKKLSKATVKRRIGTVLKIAQFARLNNYATREVTIGAAKPAAIVQVATSSLQDYGADPNRVVPAGKPVPIIHPILDVSPILKELGNEINFDSLSTQSIRDRLTAEVALFTGMRVDEVEHLEVRQILYLASDMASKPYQQSFLLWLTHTKGSKPGYVVFPSHLIRDLVTYIDTERASVVNTAKNRVGSTYRDCGALFLNGVKANHRDVGRRLKAATISRRFREAVIKCKLFLSEERFVLAPDGSLTYDRASGKPCTELALLPAHTYHDLRHTFAVVQYLIRVRRGDKDPLAIVRTLLRHSLTQTTADIYLTWMNSHERRLSELISELYSDLDASAVN